MCMCRGVATGISVEPCLPHINFQTKQGPTVLVSNVRDTALYGCSEIIQTRYSTIFTVYATVFGQLTHVFSNFKREIDHLKLDLLKSFNT